MTPRFLRNSSTKSFSGCAPARTQGQSCQVTYNTNADKYTSVKGMACASGLVCSELNDNGSDGAIFTGICNPEDSYGLADPDGSSKCGSRRVTICHRTCSPTNPWVRITIDSSAWYGPKGTGGGHMREHDVLVDCKRSDYSPWGPNTKDYLIRDHGTRYDVKARNPTWNWSQEKAYWSYWERACPYVRSTKLNGKMCCDWTKGECCGVHPNDKCPLDPNKMEPGQCGCGVPDTDTDRDGVADCVDRCPGHNDRMDADRDGIPDGCDRCAGGDDKIDTDRDGVPDFCDVCPSNRFVSTTSGLKGCTCAATEAQLQTGCAAQLVACPRCGCGRQDIDTDRDGTLDCFDVCPNDPLKTTSAGRCGCGRPETDTDGDGLPDCLDVCPNDRNKTTCAGHCGCGASEVDSDGDGTPDCKDGCPRDRTKLTPGQCGCGVPDRDSDTDGTPDCKDGCPSDNLKITPGICGCGVSDRDSDLDGTADCKDECPRDPLKTKPGVCGCGVSDVDSDKDGTPDCKDACQDDPTKIEPGLCGCGKQDSDNDGTCDANDQCPLDPNKNKKGKCGCGVSETDSDLDGTPDCIDACPIDKTKVAPGVCGCGEPDKDSDKDGTMDCDDDCVDDPKKIAPGVCGCGFSDVDSDKDGTPDCVDQCPQDASKIVPGICGCGQSEKDSDGDGTVDCQDRCPNDPVKTCPEKCGCGQMETDTDGDGTPDCLDTCPADPSKITPGECGCGTSDVDSDGDGVPDCNDKCPVDQGKITPGQCGCGKTDVDADNDGTADCNDKCPADPKKTDPGKCGCGMVDADADADGKCDHEDSCPNDPTKNDLGVCGCNVADTDSDSDGTPDCDDDCPSDPSKIAPGACGCGTPDNDKDNDGVPDCNDKCPEDADKTEPGTCGCGSPDVDSDSDGVLDCDDVCPNDPEKTAEEGLCGCGEPETDTDSDGTPDCNDLCVDDVYKIEPGVCGCDVQDTDSDNDGTPDCNDKCPMDPSKTTDVDTDGDGVYDCEDECPLNPDKTDAGICGCDELDIDSDGDGVMDCNEVRPVLNFTSSNLIATPEKYKECFKIFNAGKDDTTAPEFVETAAAYCLADCKAGAMCIKVQAAPGIQLGNTEAWFKDYSCSDSAIQPLAPGITLTRDPNGKVITWEGCFKLPEGATGENIQIHADWGYSGSISLNNTASTVIGASMDYPECLVPEGTPEDTPVASPTEVSSTPVAAPTGSTIDNDPTVGFPTANSIGDGESGGGYGDPHLKTWMGEVYDFHGACDLVLVKTPTFHNGAGLDLHIRTKIRDDWSFISDAAVRIGNDVLEVGTRAYYYLNGVAGAELPATVGGFPLTLTHFGTKRHKFEVDLGHMGVIVIKVFNEFLAVEVDNAHSDGFGDSVGLMGAFTDGSLIGRNGQVHADHNEFGLSWQVHDTDGNLFQKVEGPQYPQLCQMPTPLALMNRRMSESLVSFEDAAMACADWSEETRESCIYDVMSTGDLDMAEAGAF